MAKTREPSSRSTTESVECDDSREETTLIEKMADFLLEEK